MPPHCISHQKVDQIRKVLHTDPAFLPAPVISRIKGSRKNCDIRVYALKDLGNLLRTVWKIIALEYALIGFIAKPGASQQKYPLILFIQPDNQPIDQAP